MPTAMATLVGDGERIVNATSPNRIDGNANRKSVAWLMTASNQPSSTPAAAPSTVPSRIAIAVAPNAMPSVARAPYNKRVSTTPSIPTQCAHDGAARAMSR